MADTAGFKKLRATDLPQRQRDRLRNALQADLTQQLISAIKANPPDVDAPIKEAAQQALARNATHQEPAGH